MQKSHDKPPYEGYEEKLKRAKKFLGKNYVFHKSNLLQKATNEKTRVNQNIESEQTQQVSLKVRPIKAA